MKSLWTILAIVVLLSLSLPAAVLADSPSAQPSPTPAPGALQIVKPRQDAIVPLGDLSVEIAPLSGTAAASGWQLYLDDKLVALVPGNAISYTVSLTESGPHTIQAVIPGKPRSDPSGPLVAITAAPSTPQGPAFNLPWMAWPMGILTVGIVVLILVSLRIARRPPDYQ